MFLFLKSETEPFLPRQAMFKRDPSSKSIFVSQHLCVLYCNYARGESSYGCLAFDAFKLFEWHPCRANESAPLWFLSLARERKEHVSLCVVQEVVAHDLCA